jgi:VIT1/CCC1 family predicted Fe2+/Mn2+ transporter
MGLNTYLPVSQSPRCAEVQAHGFAHGQGVSIPIVSYAILQPMQFIQLSLTFASLLVCVTAAPIGVSHNSSRKLARYTWKTES